MNDNSYLTLSGQITNQGTIALNSTGNLTGLVIQGQIYNYNYGTFSGGLGAQLTGGGTITLSDNPNNAIFGASAVDCEGLCYPNGPAAQLINQDNTIQGAGTIGYVTSPLSQRLDLINHGLVDANASNPLILNLATASANDGIMQASNGGTLIFGSGSIDNTGGTIQALNGNALQGSTVSLQGAQISHGVVQAANGGTVSLQYGGIDHATLQALDGGAVNFSGYGSVSSSTLTTVGSGTMQTLSGGNSTFTDVTISSGSVVRMNDNSYLTLSGQITNQGTIALNSTGNLTGLVIQGQIYNYNYGTFSGGLGAQLTGGGTITLSDNPNNAIFGASAVDCEGLCYPNGPAAQLINQDNTIQGAGTIGYVTSPLSQRLDLINHGLVDANASNPLILNLATASANDGIMQASNGGTLIFGSGSIDNTGGTIQALAGSMIQFNNSALDNQGTLKVASGGTMVIASNLKNYTTGTLTGGIYSVAGTMALPVPTSESIQTNAATVILDGPSASIIKYADSSNALAGFASNTALGGFTVKNGANFATAGAFNNAGAMTFRDGEHVHGRRHQYRLHSDGGNYHGKRFTRSGALFPSREAP